MEEAVRLLPRCQEKRVYGLLDWERRAGERRDGMKRIDELQPEFVDFIPERLDRGVLYISRRYSTASHLCCCGCGLEVVTPLNPAKWHLSVDKGTVSLNPS